jgi:hypothetical protein
MSIHNIYDKIKAYTTIDKNTFMYLIIVIGVGISSFGLGRLSVVMKNENITEKTGVYITENPDMLLGASVAQSFQSTSYTSPSVDSKKYVASKNGKLYYTAGCGAAKRILAKNEVWFNSIEEAEKLGYKPSASCH